MIQLIASDMDGTLLGKKMEVLQENVEAIRFAEEHGVKFVIATGRNLSEARPPLEDVGIECPIIAVNGAQAFDEERNELFTIEINKDSADKIIKTLEDDQVYFEICADGHVYSNSPAQRIENMAMNLANMMPHLTFKMALSMATSQLDVLPIKYIDNYQRLLEDDTARILKFIAFSHEEAKVLAPIRKNVELLPDLIVTSSYPNNIEINHQYAQKGIAVKRIADKMEIDMKNVMTIGDNLNDVSMLGVAGVSFAMGNAEMDVKNVAKYVTDVHSEAGVGKAIRRAIEENL